MSNLQLAVAMEDTNEYEDGDSPYEEEDEEASSSASASEDSGAVESVVHNVKDEAMREKITQLIAHNSCDQKCITGNAAAFELLI